MGKIHKISTELKPLIYVKLLFLASILIIYLPIFFKLCVEVYIRGGLGLQMGKLYQISTELWPLVLPEF